MQVLGIEQRDRVRIGNVVIPNEIDQSRQPFFGIDIGQFERLAGAADGLVDLFQNGLEQLVLIAEIMIEHAFVDAGAPGDLIDAGIAEALGRKLLGRRSKNSLARRIRVASAAVWYVRFQSLITHIHRLSIWSVIGDCR